MNIEQKKTILFIEPAGNESSVFESYLHLPLLGCLTLGTILHNAGYYVRIYNESIMREPFDPFSYRADVYCITSLTPSANRAKVLASQIKRIYSDALVIMGGIHASLLPEEFTPIVDHVVLGEAEGIIIDLVEGKFTDKIVQGYPVESVEDLPLINYALLEGRESMSNIPMMTSRGCPFDCNFCTVTKIFGKRFRMQSAERVVAEIKNALTYFKTREFFFYDDNFTANRKRIDVLCDLLIKENIDISWTTQVRSDIAKDPELLAKMAKTGCHCFFIGFESINDATLAALHKSQTRSDIEKAIRVIHEAGINIHGMFMFGEDNESPSTINETVTFAIQQQIDTLQFMILTPFPGTVLYDEIVSQKRLLHTNWDYFDGMYAVFRPTSISPINLQRETVKAYQRFYSMGRVSIDLLKLGFTILTDALVWDFRKSSRYSFEALFLQAGATFILKRFRKTYTRYLDFLREIEIRGINK